MKLSAAVSFVVALASVAPALAVGVWQQCDVRVIEIWIVGIVGADGGGGISLGYQLHR